MFIFPISIYYEDTDAGGVVYHSNYLKFFERARSEWLKSLGIIQRQLMDQDMMFVVSKANIQFRRPALFEQNLFVETEIITIKKVSILFKQKLVDKEGCCYCEADINVACVQPSRMHPIAIPSLIIQEFTRAR